MQRRDNIKTVIKFFVVLILNLVAINAILLNSFYTINSIRQQNIDSSIERMISTHHEADFRHLCVISNCKEIGFINEVSLIDQNGTLVQKPYKKPDTYIETKHFTLTTDFNLVGFNENYGMYYISDTSELVEEILYSYSKLNIIFLLTYIIVFGIIEYKARRKRFLELVSTSNSLREKNMQILTENIHHELNTPVAIIQGNIKRLENDLKKVTSCNACTLCFNLDFEQIYSSIEQIDTVLQRMSNFKNLKYSNGNKTLMDIVGYSSNSMSIYKKSNFEIDMDPNLENYKLTGQLKNGDLLNVVSNHFRNSIEANATKIITQAKYDQKRRTMHLYIIDNGTGLRDPDTGLLLSPEKYDNIFKPYYSSKDDLGISKVRDSNGPVIDFIIKITSMFKRRKVLANRRGVGLYLNKELLNEKGGNLVLRETSINGTVFEITFPSMPVNNQ